MRYLTTSEILELHRLVIERTGGSTGVRDLNLLESAVAQPAMAFAGEDLYPTIWEKGTALAFSIIKNHPFVDGNKRTGHAAMETFLVLNGYEINAPMDEQEQIVLQVAAGTLDRQDLTDWVRTHAIEKEKGNS
jgi:death-on-curing protein